LRCSGWHRPPFPCGCGFILSSASVALQSSSPSRSRSLDRSLVSSSPKGLRPLRDISTRSPLRGDFLEATYVPPAAFLALSTVYSSCCLTGLFRPVATSWIRLQGFSPSASRSGSSPGHPVLSFLGIRLQVSKLSCSGSCRRASTGLVLAAGPWLPTGVLRLSVTRSPLEFSIPRVLLRLPLERLHVPSTHDPCC